METGRERLKGWIERSKLSQRAAARLFGVHYTYLCQILIGHRSPGLATAVRIERVTGVPAEAWVPLREATVAEPVTAAPDNRRADNE